MPGKLRLLCLVLLLWSSLSKPSGLDGFKQCAGIVDDASRLACFDAAAADLDQALPPSVAASTADSVTMPPSAAPPSRQSPQSEATKRDEFGAEPPAESFGLPTASERANIDEVSSRLIGDFTGWTGNTVFRLENGQVWRQAESGRRFFRASQPQVTIKRGSFGTFRLRVEGLNRGVKVRRIE